MMAAGVPEGLVLGGYWTRRSHVTLFTGPPFSKHLGVDLVVDCGRVAMVTSLCWDSRIQHLMAPNPKLIDWR